MRFVNKRKAVLITTWVLTVAFFLSIVPFHKTTGNTVSTGHHIFDGKNAFSYETVLAGEWELYPGILYYSDPVAETPAPVFVTVPDKWLPGIRQTPPDNGNASYRLVIDGYVPFAGRSNIVLSMMGFQQNYKVFVNGKPVNVRIPSPTGYPLYAIDEEGTVEIVIELTGSMTGLTVTPSIWAIGVHIGNIDTTRNILFVIVPLFLILFFMFFLFSFSHESRRLRPLSILGICMTAAFLLHMIWATGYMDSTFRLIDGTTLFIVCVVSRIVLVLTGIRVYFGIMSEIEHSRIRFILEASFTLIALAGLAAVVLHHYSGWMVMWFVLVLSLFLWAKVSLTVGRRNQTEWLSAALSMTMIYAAVISAFLFDWFPNQKELLYVWPVSVLILTVICFVCYYHYQREALIRTEELLEAEQFAHKTQIAMLASQIQPHFLYNTLLTIQELCRFDPEEASRVIVHFSEYLRHNIDFMNYAELVPFEEEEKHIDNYIYIQEIRFEDKLEYSADIRKRDFQIPPLTIQPLIENAIKYGVRGRIEGGFVHLQSYDDAEGIHIIVENSGPGFDPEKARDDHSIGNIRKRLSVLLDAKLIIDSREGQEGTKIKILIPRRQGEGS